jgi:hypothetical protein
VTNRSPSPAVQHHVRTRLLKLGAEVASQRRVYLDKCFWVRLRDQVSGVRPAASTALLLDALRTEVRQGGLVCPISDTLFLELLGQSDLETRRATAELIDEFSKGVSILPHEERFDLEVKIFALTKVGIDTEPVEHQVWSRVAFVLGIQHPVPHPALPADTIQIGFFDHMWELPLTKMLDVIGAQMPPDPFFKEQAVLLNQGNVEHADELTSFRQAYRDELAGALDLAVPLLQRTLESVNRSISSQPSAWSDEDLRTAHALLVAAAQTQDGRLALRTAHLAALMHAATRWNKTKRLTPNDLPDFLHAQAAIAYCHAFFTDGPTRHMLEQRHLNIQNHFTCFTASTDSAAVEWLRSYG